MFHHFHGLGHGVSQGSIASDEFDAIIRHVDRHRIRDPRDWCRKVESDELEPGDLCITFDDGLRCQYDIALPVLRRHGLRAFWFAYTSVLSGEGGRLEIYRHFRHACFDSVDAYYRAFFEMVASGPYGALVRDRLNGFDPDSYVPHYTLYTRTDRTFRFVRDQVLGADRYYEIMDAMIAASDLDVPTVMANLWLTDAQIRELHADGHIIGLHSHTHPTRLGELTPNGQRGEYERNSREIARLTGEAPKSVSHPCGHYTDVTLSILKDMGVTVGFRDNLNLPAGHGPLEYPREDHGVIIRELITR